MTVYDDRTGISAGNVRLTNVGIELRHGGGIFVGGGPVLLSDCTRAVASDKSHTAVRTHARTKKLGDRPNAQHPSETGVASSLSSLRKYKHTYKVYLCV